MESADLFGKAVVAYQRGDRNPFFLSNGGRRFPHDLSRYFRTAAQLQPLERKAISLAQGDILDIGCATAYYFPALAEKGKVRGIDVSPRLIALAKKDGFDCERADIFTYRSAQRYDTITLFENNLGMGETPEKTERMLEKLAGLLESDGQILCVLTNEKEEFFIAELQPEWKGERGERFRWIFLSPRYLQRLCSEAGLRLEIVASTERQYLARMTLMTR